MEKIDELLLELKNDYKKIKVNVDIPIKKILEYEINAEQRILKYKLIFGTFSFCIIILLLFELLTFKKSILQFSQNQILSYKEEIAQEDKKQIMENKKVVKKEKLSQIPKLKQEKTLDENFLSSIEFTEVVKNIFGLFYSPINEIENSDVFKKGDING